MPSNQPSPFDINDLVLRAGRGDKSAEQDLMRHLSVSFRLFAQHRVWNDQDAEEVVQDALVTILSKYRGIEFETSFAGWAYQVLNHKILDYVKKKQTRKKLDEQVAADTAAAPQRSADPGLRQRLIDCFRKLGRSNVRHARILNLHRQGYGTGEICRKLGLTENNFYVLLMRARRALEICLGKDGSRNG